MKPQKTKGLHMSKHAALPLWNEANNSRKLTILKDRIEDLHRYVFAKNIAEVIQTLEDHSSSDQKEIQDINLIIKMCTTYPDIFSSYCEAGHITGSALIVEPTSKKILLHYHISIGKWLQFGGHSEYETTPWQIAYREAIEETNLTDLEFYPAEQNPTPIDIDAHIIAARQDQPEHYHLDFRYLFVTKQPELVTVSGESREYKWVDFDDINSMELDYALRRLIAKAKTKFY